MVSGTEFGWLLERGPAETPKYLTVDCGVFDWTPDHAKAMQFARRADAEMMAQIVEDADRVVEQWEHDEQRAMENEIERLRGIVVECRSSVKFDLLHYEKMARAYGNLGAEGEQTHAASEAEAQRLHELLAKIDALALKPPNANVCGLPHGKESK